jgi:hypothetical protein
LEGLKTITGLDLHNYKVEGKSKTGKETIYVSAMWKMMMTADIADRNLPLEATLTL